MGPRERRLTLQPGAAVNVRHRNGTLEAATILAAHGTGRIPLTYFVRFACGCTLKGVDPACVEAV